MFPQKVVWHNNHLRRNLYDHYDIGLRLWRIRQVVEERAMKMWMRGICWVGLIVGVAVAAGGCVGVGVDIPSAARAGITQEELVRRTQELMDSVAGGDQRPWKKYFAEDSVYFDEKGTSMDKGALVKSVQALPAGYSGAIKIAGTKSRIMEDVAILSYDMDETETVFGQKLRARYHATDTWVRRNGEWQIVAGQVLRYYEDPAPGRVDGEKYKEYVGTYEVSPGNRTTISMDGEKLLTQRGNGPKDELIPEAGDIFFRRGVEGRCLFRRGVDGKVNATIQRRNNEDVVWKKIG
jgi:hypothetical protein